MKSKRIWIILINLICILILVVAMLLDTFMQFTLQVNFSIACSICLTILTIVFTVWFSYLLVMKQLYSSKYAKAYTNDYINSGKWIILINFIILFLFGLSISIIGKTYFISHIAFCFMCFIYFMVCSVSIYKKINKNEVSSIINDKVGKIIDSINNSDHLDFKAAEIKKLNDIYESCYYKNDIGACTEIINAYSEFVKKHLEYSTKKYIEGKDKEVSAESKIILDGIYKLFKMDDSDFVLKTNLLIIQKIYDLAEVTIKCNSIELYKKLNTIYSKFLKSTHILHDTYCEHIYRCLTLWLLSSIKQDKSEFFEFTEYQAIKLYYSLNIRSNYVNIMPLCVFYISGLLFCLGDDNKNPQYKNLYNKLFEKFEDLIINDADDKSRETVLIMLNAYIHEDEFIANQEAQESFFASIEKLINNKVSYRDHQSIRFIAIILKYYEENKFIEIERIKDAQCNFASRGMMYLEDAPSYIIPSFLETIKADLYNTDKNEKYSAALNELVSQCITKLQISNLAILLNETCKILECFQQKDKELQKKWLNIFFSAFYQGSLTENFQHFNLILKYFKMAIAGMDKDNNISKDLGEHIIESLENLSVRRYRENDNFVCEIVEVISEFVYSKINYNFINDKSAKATVYKTIYHIGVDGIEKNQPLVIKRVSNILGWKLYHTLDDGNNGQAELLLDLSFSLFKLCFVNNIDEQTKVFVGTLFIIIGAYCKASKKSIFERRIIEKLKLLKCKKYIDAARQLREVNISTWDILGQDPKSAVNGFISDAYKDLIE